MTTATKFTPGPWKLEGYKVYAFGRGWIAVLPLPQNGGTFDVEANARLITASPRLYGAARAALDLLDNRHEGDVLEAKVIGKLRGALAEVDGAA